MNKYLINEMDYLYQITNAIQKIVLGVSDNEKIIAYYFDNKSETTIVLVGMPHGNEPIGFFYCRNWLLNDRLNTTYNYLIVPILDYDVAMENSWICESFEYKDFLLNNYINKVTSQIEFNYGNTVKTVYHQVFIDLLSTLEIHCILFIHQTPSIYGGYFYTNISDKVMINELKQCFVREKIPPEFWGQGDVIKKDIGVFGVFSAKNISDDGSYLSSQEYVSEHLQVPYVSIEIPFAIPCIKNFDKPICLDISIIFKIISLSKEIENMIININENEKYKMNFAYWIGSNNKTDEHIKQCIMNLREYKMVDVYFILRSFMLKLSYLSMGLKMTGLSEEGKLKIKTLEKRILKFYESNKTILGIKIVDYESGIRCINSCVEIIERYSKINYNEDK
jgi:hypothetical protein